MGRTARAENNGWALTLVGPAEHKGMGDIERFLGAKVPVLEGAERLMPAKEEVVLDQPRRQPSGGSRGGHRNGRRGGEGRQRAAGARGSGRGTPKGGAEGSDPSSGRGKKQPGESQGKVIAEGGGRAKEHTLKPPVKRRRRSRGSGGAPKVRGQGDVKSGDGGG